jgi:hypothetical protein
MNADQIEILGLLRNRIKEIMTALERERVKNENLKIECNSFKARNEQQAKKLEELEHKYNNLKMAKVLAGQVEDGHDARVRVNRIVREIDKCIALLNR